MSGNNRKSVQMAKVLLQPLQPWVKREVVPRCGGETGVRCAIQRLFNAKGHAYWFPGITN